jgi:phosphoglycolate phosphatase
MSQTISALSHIVLDLDGTISDPLIGIWRSINHALSGFGYAELTAEQAADCIGPPLDESFARITGTASPAHLADLVARYRERYAELGYRENALYPGVTEALDALVARGTRLGLCTSKRRDFAEQILDLFGIRDRFDFVNGGEIGVKKSEQLAGLLQAGTIGPGSIMVGDRAVDVLAARANGLAAAGVLWGYGSREELESAGPHRLVERPPQLAELEWVSGTAG